MARAVGDRHDLDDVAEALAARRRLPRPSDCRAIRVAAGASQRRVAEALGVDVMTVSRWERGEHAPSGDLLVAYLDLLDALRAIAAGS
jgi:DNA-binding transcriptional regulator YiaG